MTPPTPTIKVECFPPRNVHWADGQPGSYLTLTAEIPDTKPPLRFALIKMPCILPAEARDWSQAERIHHLLQDKKTKSAFLHLSLQIKEQLTQLIINLDTCSKSKIPTPV